MKKIVLPVLAALTMFFESNSITLPSSGSADIVYQKSKLEPYVLAVFHCETSPIHIEILKRRYNNGVYLEERLTSSPGIWQHMKWTVNPNPAYVPLDGIVVKKEFEIWYNMSIAELATALSEGYGCKVVVTEPE
ncbi:MAG: hypothetical protein LBJ71_00500 [Holosporaceae bacterium]|jgi:hypothetical protein|nr:hypothetical protein [Holosporaceae bacterium]